MEKHQHSSTFPLPFSVFILIHTVSMFNNLKDTLLNCVCAHVFTIPREEKRQTYSLIPPCGDSHGVEHARCVLHQATLLPSPLLLFPCSAVLCMLSVTTCLLCAYCQHIVYFCMLQLDIILYNCSLNQLRGVRKRNSYVLPFVTIYRVTVSATLWIYIAIW